MTWYREQKPLWEKHRAAGGEPAPVIWTAFGGALVVGAILAATIWGLQFDAAQKSFDSGVRAMDQKRHAEAAVEFRKVLAREPDYQEARYNLALALFCIDANDDAMAELGKIPQDAAIYARAHALYERGKSAQVLLGSALMKDHCN